MDVVFRATDWDGNHFVILANSCDVGPQPGLHLVRDRIATFFGAEDQVDVVASIRMGHSAAPPGLYPIPSSAPPLPQWATVFRPLRDFQEVARLVADTLK